MKKLIALFLTLAVMLAGLLGIALADTAPEIGKLTVGSDGTVTLKVIGEEAGRGYISFQTPEGRYAGNVYIYIDRETGLLTGKYYSYSSYPDAVVSSYTLYGESTYDYQYSEDGKTKTDVSTDIYYEYDANGILTRANSTRSETVGEETKWTYKPAWAEKASEYSDYATTSYKTQTEIKNYTGGEVTGTTTTVESYKVKLSKTPENTWLNSFSPNGYRDYELISAERSETEKGTSEYGEEIKTTRVADLATTWSATEETYSGSEQKYINWQEDTVTGSLRETRKGIEIYSWNNTKTQIDETTVTVYGDDKTKTESETRNNKFYDQETNELTRIEKENIKTDSKYTTIEYPYTNYNGETQTRKESGYAVTAYSGNTTSEKYKNNELTSLVEHEYDLTVKLKEDARYILDGYSSGEYDVIKGKEIETRKEKSDQEGNSTWLESDSKEESVYPGDDTRLTTRTENNSYYNKETGSLTQLTISQSLSEYQNVEDSYQSGGETYTRKAWQQKNNHSENQTTYYNSEGKRTADSSTTSNYEYDYIASYQRETSYVNDTVSHSYYPDTQAVSSETVSHNQWALEPKDHVRNEQYMSNTVYYSKSGAYTGKRVEETIRTRAREEWGGYVTWTEGWPIADSVTSTKEYNKDDVLTYEYTATENRDTAKSTTIRRSGTGKVEETQSAMTDKKNGTSSNVRERFNTYTGQPTYEYTRTGKRDKEGNWEYTSQYTYNNDDGSLRRKIVYNPDGSVIRYNSSNQIAAQKSADGMWTDGAGNRIGPDRDVNISFKQRTGEIDGYGVSVSSENESTYTWYEDGKITYQEKAIYKADGTVDYYEDGILRRSTEGDTTRYFDAKGNLTSFVKYDSVKSEMSEFDSEGKLTRIYDERGNETRYDKAGKVLYSRKNEYSEKDGVDCTVYYDGEGKEFARLYEKSKDEDKDDGTYHRESTKVRIAGTYYYGESGDDGYTKYELWDPASATVKLEKQVSEYDSRDETDPVTQEHVSISTETSDYTKWTVINGNKTAEVTRSERNETRSGDGYYENRTYRDGVLTNEYRSEDNEDGNTSRSISKSYNARTGRQESVFKVYYDRETPFTRNKTYDRYDNLQRYEIIDNTDSWNWGKEYYANGTQAGESWYDDLDGDGEYYARYYLNGNKAYESSRNEDNSIQVSYNEDGSYSYWSETNDGITTSWAYDAKGSLTGIIRNEHYEDGMNSYERWDAEKLLYTATHGSENGRYTETYRDPEGNTLVYSDGGCTLTLAAPGDGWRAAFGGWFFLENGEPVRDTWKQFGSDWYYFNYSGRMTTGVVGDGSTVYAMNKDGTLSDGGWTETEDGWTYTNADGVVTTGWQQIDGKWYYFNDGWYFKESEYTAESEWFQDSYRGIMQTGATKIWNSDWQTQHTYFFNEDGTWDNSPGWKSTNGYDDDVEYHYYDENGTEVTGWQQIGGKWYYFNEDGVMRNGWVGSGSTWYYMEPATGEMATGWVQEKFEDDWFHMDASGVMQTGWQQIDGKWYYFKDDGKMASGEWVGSYYMGTDGAMSTGWVKDGGKWYYLNADGIKQTGWLQDGGSWYYLYSGGGIATGQAAIDGRNCIFDAGGVWLGYAD